MRSLGLVINDAGATVVCIQDQPSSITGETNPGGLIASIEQSICSRMVSAVLPMMKPGMPVRATVPMTMQSTASRLAKPGISSRVSSSSMQNGAFGSMPSAPASFKPR